MKDNWSKKIGSSCIQKHMIQTEKLSIALCTGNNKMP